jgi:hypothetical protein
MRARREVVSAVAERYRAAGRSEKGRILDELCSVTGWHRKHAIRVLSPSEKSVSAQQRQRTYGIVSAGRRDLALTDRPGMSALTVTMEDNAVVRKLARRFSHALMK